MLKIKNKLKRASQRTPSTRVDSKDIDEPEARGHYLAELDRLLTAESELEGELKRLEKKKMDSDDKVQSLKMEQIDLQAKMRGLQQMTEKYKTELDKETKSYSVKLSNMETEKAELLVQKNTLETDLIQTLDDLESAEEMEELMKDEVTDLKALVTSLKEEMFKFKLEIEHIKLKKDLTVEQVDAELEKMLSDEYSNSVNEMQSAHTKKESKFVQQFKQLHTQLTDLKSSSEVDRFSLESENKELMKQADELKKNEQETLNILDEMEIEKAEIQKRIIEEETDRKKAEIELQRSKETCNDFAEKLKQKKQKIIMLHVKIEVSFKMLLELLTEFEEING